VVSGVAPEITHDPQHFPILYEYRRAAFDDDIRRDAEFDGRDAPVPPEARYFNAAGVVSRHDLDAFARLKSKRALIDA
jgi:hypothetical protein